MRATELKLFTKSFMVSVNNDELMPTKCVFISFMCH